MAFAAEEDAPAYAFPEKFMLRAGAYFVDSSNTQFSVNANKGVAVGSSIDYKKDLGYLLSPKWSLQYIVEAFAIKLEDKFRGSLLNFELNTEYRLLKNFALGVGIASLGLDADVTSDAWRGAVTDRYAGFTAFGTLYF